MFGERGVEATGDQAEPRNASSGSALGTVHAARGAEADVRLPPTVAYADSAAVASSISTARPAFRE